MPFAAIVIDLLTLGSYFLQLNNGFREIYLLGLAFQAAMTILLLAMLLSYHGKRSSGWQPLGYAYPTIRFSIIILSFIINAMVLSLYVLNYYGINDLIFSAF